MRILFTFIGLLFLTSHAYSQNSLGELSLEECFHIAEQNNTELRQQRQSINTRQLNYEASKLSMLPKLNLLGTYQYLSDPIKDNLQTVREGNIEGSSHQSVD